jgi:hypothetical protein
VTEVPATYGSEQKGTYFTVDIKTDYRWMIGKKKKK